MSHGIGGIGSDVRVPYEVNVRLSLLGGFRAETTEPVLEAAWQQRRSAKQLVKLMATLPGHSLHREQVLELLWPEVEFSSAVNSFGKALYVARRALEPDMPSRGTSSYLRLVDDILTLVTDNIWIDIDHFRAVADAGLRHGEKVALEAALGLYQGELLPEDTYESWTIQVRDQLAELHVRVLLALADVLEQTGNRDGAIERLNQILRLDAAREDIHRRLMRMHAESGRRLLALRQYHVCCEALERELDAKPESETVALLEDIRADRIARDERVTSSFVPVLVDTPTLPAAIQQLPSTPFVGRDALLRGLADDFLAAEGGHGRTVMVHGETGVGKSRLVAEAARAAAQKGGIVLWGTSHDNESPLPYGPFIQALEAYVATLSLSERETLANRYPELTGHIPSLLLTADTNHMSISPRVEQGQLFTAIVRMLTDLATQQTIVLVVDDAHAASWESVRLLHHIAHLAASRRWLVLGSYREEAASASNGMDQVLTSLTRQGFCRQLLLSRLTRQECDALVRGLIPAGSPSTEVLEYVYSMTLGNPLFITELVGALQGRGQLSIKDDMYHLESPMRDSVPIRVQKLIDLRMRGMDQRSRRVLELLSVADIDLSFIQVHMAVHEVIEPDIAASELLDLLDSALQSHILREQEHGYVFAHPLFRAGVRGQLSYQRRQRLHDAVARAVEASASTESGTRESDRKAELQRTVRHLERAVNRAQTEGSWADQEVHLWKLLEGLQLLGRREDADRVRQRLRALLQNVASYSASYDVTRQFEAFA